MKPLTELERAALIDGLVIENTENNAVTVVADLVEKLNEVFVFTWDWDAPNDYIDRPRVSNIKGKFQKTGALTWKNKIYILRPPTEKEIWAEEPLYNYLEQGPERHAKALEYLRKA